MVKHTDSVVRTIATCWGGPVVVLTSPISAFTGFDSYAWIAIGVESLEGLLVSLLLRHTDSVVKTFATCWGGPVVVLISPISTHIGSSAASGLFALLVLWFGVAVPLVFFGAYVMELLVRTSPVPREIPKLPWCSKSVLTSLVRGRDTSRSAGAVSLRMTFVAEGGRKVPVASALRILRGGGSRRRRSAPTPSCPAGRR